jgi:hypothetical protein
MKIERSAIPAELLHDFVANVDRPEQFGADWLPAPGWKTRGGGN